MKGISLPVNMIVILAIVILLLLVVGSFFMSGMAGSMSQADAIQAFSDGCRNYCGECTTISNMDEYHRNVPGADITENQKKFIQACETLGYISPGQGVGNCFTLHCPCSTECVSIL